MLTAGVVVLMAAAVLCLSILVSTAFAPPGVGELVLFKPGTSVAGDVTLTAQRAGDAGPLGATCVLDPQTMVEGGGSLAVERRMVASRTYQVHWAGARTSQREQDCGTSADLLLSGSDLQTLVNVMGGRGIAGRGFVF